MTGTLDPRCGRRLGRRSSSLAEFEPLARAAMDPAAFDYVAGGRGTRSASPRTSRPGGAAGSARVCSSMSRAVDPSTTLLGGPVAFPVAVAPMAVHGLAHPDGELATARAAAAAGVPFILSTMSSRSIEEVAAGAPEPRAGSSSTSRPIAAATRSLVERAAAAGYGAIVLTVDLPGARLSRTGPCGPGSSCRPLGNFADGPSERTATALAAARARSGPGRFDALVWDDIATIRSWSSLPLVLKGILTAEDARLAVEHGVDAIVVSNHGARQLDRDAGRRSTCSPRSSPRSTAGPRSGSMAACGAGLDIAIALALGARGVLVGRPISGRLAAGGQAGVERALADPARGVRDRAGAARGADASRHPAGAPRRLSPTAPIDRFRMATGS